MKKIAMSLLATLMLVGFSSFLQADDAVLGDDYCTVAKSDPYGFSPAIVGISNPDLMLLAENEGDLRGEEILIMAIKVTHDPLKLAADIESTMLMANLNRNTTIYVSSIGGFGGAPISQTGVSDIVFI